MSPFLIFLLVVFIIAVLALGFLVNHWLFFLALGLILLVFVG